jgi:ribonuclease BN (tRNA processing enzyme)
MTMRVQILGSGDAFGSGGRLNTCFLVHRDASSFLIDCGASVMIAIRRFGVDPNQIRAIFLTHLHADHFGGLPFFILDAQLVSRRTAPLAIIGPKGTTARLHALMEASFPGSADVERRFSVEVTEIEPSTLTHVPIVQSTVTGYLVSHPSGSPSLGLRIECDGRVIACTGDTEWVDNIIDIGRDSDLFFAEAYWFERKVRFHLDFATLRDHLPAIAARKVILTHMSPDMLLRDPAALTGCQQARDGMVFDLL